MYSLLFELVFILRFVFVTNLVATHHTTTAHHPWTTTPIIHCTTTHTFPSTIAPITQLSPITNQPWLSCHTCTSFTHPHISSTLPHTRCEVLSLPRLTFLSVSHPASCDLCVWPRTARPLNLCLWPRLLPGIVYVSALPLIFLVLPADRCLFDSASV